MLWRSFLLITAIAATLILAGSAVAQAEGAAILARDEPVEGRGASAGSAAQAYDVGGKPAASSKKREPNTKRRTKPKPAPTVTKPRPWNGFVVGDKYTFLNFEVVSAEKPWYTREAKANGAKGLVQVEVLIETNGTVISAKARTGNKLLHPEAERAALASKFNRPTFGGKPARAIGFLVYRFGSAEEDEN